MARAPTFASRFSPRERARSSILPLERGIPVDAMIRGREARFKACRREKEGVSLSFSLDLSYPFRISSISNLMRNRGRFGASVYPSNAFWIWAITPITLPRGETEPPTDIQRKVVHRVFLPLLFFFLSIFLSLLSSPLLSLSPSLPLIFIPPSAPPFRSSSTFYLFGEIYQQFSLFTTNSLVLSRAGIPGHDQEWVLQLIRGRLFIYSRLEERFLPPSKDSPTFQPSCNFDASQKKKKAISTTAGLCIIKRRATIHRRTTFPPSHLLFSRSSVSLLLPFSFLR